jgi:hypothetical protein
LIDFEFNNPQEEVLNLVCACFVIITDNEKEAVKRVWLHNDREAWKGLAVELAEYKDTHVFIAYAVTAEARSLLSLGLDPHEFTWVDLYAEWLQIRYNNNDYKYGRYLYEGPTRDGVYKRHIRRSVAPSYDASENIGKDNTETGTGYAGCACALLGVIVDTGRKNKVRDLIISAPDKFTEAEQKEIMDYCESDLDYLDPILEKVTQAIEDVTFYPEEIIFDWQTNRGEFSASMAIIEAHGIPVNMEKIKNLSRNHWEAVDELVQALNEEYVFYEKKRKRKSDLKGYWSFTYKRFAGWVEENSLDVSWPRTDTGNYSTKSEVLKEYSGIDIIDKLRDTQKSIKHINWFRESAYEQFAQSVGSDGRLRTFFGVFGTQTGRNAPSAKRFPFAMSKWLRCIVQPEPGKAITEIDYSNEEFIIAAFKSEDQNMIDAYESGDPYLYFAILGGGAPQGATKESHPGPRKKFKATVLGLQFGMGPEKLAAKLRADTGDKSITEDDARELRQIHKEVFSEYWNWVDDITDAYQLEGFLLLPDGWILGPHCDRIPSMRNFPIQGLGASIIRRCCFHAIKAGLDIVTPLHDAMYIQHDIGDSVALEKLKECMQQAVKDVIPGCNIRVDSETHEHGEVWVHEDGQALYDRMKKFLEHRQTDLEVENELITLLYEA